MGVGALSLVLLLQQGFDSGYYEHEEHRFFNWITYGHLVPAAALIAAAVLLRPRAAAAEQPHDRVRSLESPVMGLAAIVTVFLWINLTILNLFSAPGDRLSFGFERMQDRDLTTSLAWAIYALVLLGLGMRLHRGGLRWTSLVLLLATIAKLFLYDLSELEGLYRVGSFAGLAVSLLCVSLLYQRFVFRAAPEPRG